MVSIHPAFFTHAPSAVRMQSVCVSAEAAQKRTGRVCSPPLIRGCLPQTHIYPLFFSNPNVVSL